MRTPLIFAGALAATVVAACAATAPGQRPAGLAQRQCFRAADVNNFWGASDDSVYVGVGVNDVYQLSLSGICNDIDWANRIALRSRGGTSWVCHGLDAELLIPGPIGAQRCLVTGIRKLSPEEIKVARNRK